MSVETQYEWTCDVCSSKAIVQHSGPPNARWLKLEFENKYCDRDWYHRVVCSDCVAKIADHAAKNPKPAEAQPK